MFKVMIVDDEYWIRQGIIQVIPWRQLDMELVGEAEDGETAYEMACELRPDLVFMDMRMPGWDGRMLISKLQETLPDALVIVISGYSDFSYTREAIKHRAFDYLLKPVKQHELLDILSKVKERLDETKQDENDQSARQEDWFQASARNEESLSKHIVQDILGYIEHAYDQPVTLQELADKLHTNADYLGRLFKKQTGHNFVDYLTDYRIHKCKEMIQETTYKNYEIASMVGYEDYRYFSQVFKKRLGMTIGEYRSKMAR